MNKTFTMSALRALGALGIAVLISTCSALNANNSSPKFRIIAFFTATQYPAHISFVQEANRRFPEMAAKYNFGYDTTSNWQNLNSEFLADYQVVIFLDTRPEDPAQRAAFKGYMEHGGAWMGFHFAGFALTPSAYPANWNWYHTPFSGQAHTSATCGDLHRRFYVWKIAAIRLLTIYPRLSSLRQTSGTDGRKIFGKTLT
jgi:Trehalose utilisation